MAREPIFGELHPDIACAIALGIVENLSVTATLDNITMADARRGASRSHTGWLGADDPLDQLTRAYFRARREAAQLAPGMGAKGWAAAAHAKKRDEANIRALAAKAKGRQLLEERGMLSHARSSGLRVQE